MNEILHAVVRSPRFSVRPSAWIRVCFALLVLPCSRLETLGQETIRSLIDRELAPPAGLVIPTASDAEFLRRVSLDLNGMPPTADDARAFLTDPDPAKREKLVDRLLASPLYARHLAATLDVMLMERRPNTNISQDEWMAWLTASVRNNKPWNVLVRELITADGNTPESRAPSRFILDRAAEPNVVARDMGRFFFGRDLQCAQCHDSPLVADFAQKDYQGLLAISSSTYMVTKKVDGKDVNVLGERVAADLTFESVFSKGNAHRTGARLPGSTTLIEPFLIPGEDYLVAPADGVPAIPKVSRRMLLAEHATNGSNRLFNENAANRLWSIMFGRGLVHALDMMHPDNPAANPALLHQLGERLAASGFDMRNFLREVALSQVYQRPFDLPNETLQQLAAAKAEQEAVAKARAQLEQQSIAAASARDTADDAFGTAEKAMLPVAAELDAARTQYVETRKKLDEATKAFNDSEAAFKARQNVAELLKQSLTSLQSAAATLPQDQDVAAAAKTLDARITALVAELPALQNAVAEKSAAVTAPTEQAKSARAALEAAAARLKPLEESVRGAEAAFVAARAAFSDSQQQFAAAERRLRILETMGTASDARVSADQAAQTVVAAETQWNDANQQVADMMPVVQQKSAALQTAESQLAAASASLKSAQSTLEMEQKRTENLKAARDALARASQSLAGDQELSQISQTLNSRAEAVQSQFRSAETVLVSATQMMQQATLQMQTAQSDMNQIQADLQRKQDLAGQMQAALAAAKATQQAASESLNTALEPLPETLASHFLLMQLKPLTPEQMCWTVFRVTRVYDNYVAAEIAEMDKTAPLSDEQKQDPKVLAERQIQLEQRVFDKLKGHIGSYAPLYGGAPGQPQNEFYASPDQALFTSNGGSINSWVGPSGDNAAARIAQATDARKAAEELYLAILTRMPTDEEAAEVDAFLRSRSDRAQAAKELVWGLLSSAEFRFNH